MKKKIIIVVALAAGLIALWFMIRQQQTDNIYDLMGTTPEELARYQGKPAYNDPQNWEGYEFGDPVPEAAKK